jgi:hypothetical protein
VLDLPEGLKGVWGGMDIGLTLAPTVIHLYNEEKVGKRPGAPEALPALHLERFRTRQIREVLYALAFTSART